LVGASITRAVVTPSTLDLSLDFDNEFSLDVSPSTSPYDAYTIRLDKDYFTARTDGYVQIERH